MMNKKILSLALAAFSMIPVTAMAQQSAQSCSSEKSCTEQSCGKQRKGAPDQFEGIQLTEAQRTRLAGVKMQADSAKLTRMKARKAECTKDGRQLPEAGKSAKQGKDCKQGKACEGQKCDSAAVAARKQARKEAMAARKQAKSDYLKQVKDILTPEQYVQFLENNYMQAGRHGGKQAKMNGRKGGKGSKHGMASKSGKQGKKGDRQGKRGEGRQQKQLAATRTQS